jgi:hypothetical protein
MSKFRLDFVTNSSSSSYTVAYEIKDCPKLREYMKEEHGKQGIAKYEKYLVAGINLLNKTDDSDFRKEFSMWEDDDEFPFEIDATKYYIWGSRVSYTNEGDSDSESMDIVDMIPNEYKERVYEGDC